MSCGNLEDDAELACPSPESVLDSVVPDVGREEAIVVAYGEGGGSPVSEARLEYYRGGDSRDGTPILCPLAWAVSFEPAGLVNSLVVYVDATTGRLLSASRGLGGHDSPSETPD